LHCLAVAKVFHIFWQFGSSSDFIIVNILKLHIAVEQIYWILLTFKYCVHYLLFKVACFHKAVESFFCDLPIQKLMINCFFLCLVILVQASIGHKICKDVV